MLDTNFPYHKIGGLYAQTKKKRPSVFLAFNKAWLNQCWLYVTYEKKRTQRLKTEREREKNGGTSDKVSVCIRRINLSDGNRRLGKLARKGKEIIWLVPLKTYLGST